MKGLCSSWLSMFFTLVSLLSIFTSWIWTTWSTAQTKFYIADVRGWYVVFFFSVKKKKKKNAMDVGVFVPKKIKWKWVLKQFILKFDFKRFNLFHWCQRYNLIRILLLVSDSLWWLTVGLWTLKDALPSHNYIPAYKSSMHNLQDMCKLVQPCVTLPLSSVI